MEKVKENIESKISKLHELTHKYYSNIIGIKSLFRQSSFPLYWKYNELGKKTIAVRIQIHLLGAVSQETERIESKT
jgi:hypothetical protein